MLTSLKAKLKQKLIDKQTEYYNNEAFRQSEPYAQWILEQEGTDLDLSLDTGEAFQTMAGLEGFRVIFYEDCGSDYVIPWESYEYLIFMSKNGRVSPDLIEKLKRTFRNPEINFVYTDEDRIDEITRKREDPWFKEAWSPVTLLSVFYIGHLFAIRTKIAKKLDWRKSPSYEENIYDFVLRFSELVPSEAFLSSPNEKKTGISKEFVVKHLDDVLYHSSLSKEDFEQAMWTNEQFDLIKKQSERNLGFLEGMPAIEQQLLKVSIIIPSKDHPRLLSDCLLSLKKISTYKNIEIIVIDNGSNPENKRQYEEVRGWYHFQYCYEPMDFNFSTMCNLGANHATGDYLIFLNDDMEIIQEDWIEKLLYFAIQENIGAVGAKLLYPKSGLIQHVGVSNLAVGPAHKLIGFEDKTVYYHGKNRFCWNVLAVTAACLMIGRDKFFENHAFSKELMVAYNDVEFCFRLFEHGLYNVQCNNVTLLHHESFSRGQDEADRGKWQRLLLEKDKLYKKHPLLRGYDPFHSSHLKNNSPSYFCNYHYEYENTKNLRVVYHCKKWGEKTRKKWYNESLMITVDHAGIEKRLESSAPEVLLIEGWSYILSVDNSRYNRWVLFIDEKNRCYKAPILSRYRKDVLEILPDQVNVALTGFVCRIKTGSLKKGKYRIGILCKDTCSRQYLYKESNKELLLEE